MKMNQMKELELYLHIPFCVKKCAYCDFLSGPGSEEMISDYVDALITEIKASCYIGENRTVTSIFFGGGTPSILEGEQMMAIMKALTSSFAIADMAEITMEMNPGTVTREKLLLYKEAGINRLSIGLQSTHDEELKLLSRIHTYGEFLESYQLAREVGFSNINIDLISAIPKQTIESWRENLNRIVALAPEHISAYSLIVEEGTPFYEDYKEEGKKYTLLPSGEEERQMYADTEDILGAAGYHRYEISNYAKEGCECRHNLGYWERKDYLGLGLGSASLLDNERFCHPRELKDYMENVQNPEKLKMEQEVLDQKSQMEEFMFLGLRKMEGICVEQFYEAFGVDIMDVYGTQITALKKDQLLIEDSPYIRLSKRGIDISNRVMSEFL